MSGILGIPIKYRIKNVLKLIPEEYGIPSDSKILDILRSKSGDEINVGNKKNKFPNIESVNYEKGEFDPIWFIYDLLWFKYDINKFGHNTEEHRKAELSIVQQHSPNKLLIRAYGSKPYFKAPIGSIEKKDWNYTKSIMDNVEEKDVAIITAIRETREETGIDITKIPNYLKRINLKSLEKVKNVFIYKFMIVLSLNEYNKNVIQVLKNPTEEFFDLLDPEISEIKYI